MLRRDVEPGNPGRTARRAYVPGHLIAGRTETSQDTYSAAYVGATPEITASVMVLNPERNQNVGGFGGNKPVTIWHDAMAPNLDARGSGEFPPATRPGSTAKPSRCRGARASAPARPR